uniref:Uncharacterized protein n=1 Tax=Glossina morsitans morsitans TaxID=37546 RepID=A0A1B0FN30_GLOMM
MKLVYGVHYLILIIMLAFSEIRVQGADTTMGESGQASAQFGMGAATGAGGGGGGGDGAGKAQSAASAGMTMGAGVSGTFGGPALPSDR